MAAVANTAHGHQAWALVAAIVNRSSSRLAATTATRALVSTGFAGAPNAWAGRPRRAVTVRTKADAAEVRRPPSSPDAVTYSASISTDTPLHETPGASFDEYLQDRARVFRAMFPDESRSERIGDGEWRIQMLPLQFLLLTVRPVVVMQLRHRAGGLDLRVGEILQGEWRIQMLPLQFLLLTVRPVVVMQLRHRAGGLDLRVTEWELRGLDSDNAPSSFDLGVSGSLYADRSRGGRRAGCRMRGHLEIAITVVMPPPMRLVPEGVLRGVAESVLSRLAGKMKRDVDVSLIADFQRFRREKAAASRARPTLDATASDRDEASQS
ncbi:hypothetical protein BAE44_0007649 [Dichanthelium oligosanthes]|uniref:Uncharacterized protein n=1 Tax=Dichanthelium oligosanthes TaxID=888268 RepID=A0A1E5W1W7_9POAL|nr:hypothetical protein BAE44_0007649 [Dichanthelium oligosanthes]